MKKEVITFRATKKTLENIQDIKKQLLTTGLFEEEELNNSRIIRLAIKTLKEKAKFLIWEKDGKISTTKNEKEQ